VTRPRVVIVLAVLLLVSVGLNLFFAGLAGGRAAFRPHDPPPGSLPIASQIAQHLPKEDRPVFREMMQARGRAIRSIGLAQREAGLDIVRAARAEPFDADALRRALSDQREKSRAAREVRDEAFVELMAHLSPEGRRALIDSLPGFKEQAPPN
jgi:uncharacterized membrane protein